VSVGEPLSRIEGREKVTGAARYAYEWPCENLAYAVIVQSTIAKGHVHAIDESAARAHPGVIAIVTHANAVRLAKAGGELGVLQTANVAYRGQAVAVVVAETLEAAQEAERLVRIDYDVEEHDVVLRSDHPRLYKPEQVNPAFPSDTEEGDVDEALKLAAVSIDRTYETGPCCSTTRPRARGRRTRRWRRPSASTRSRHAWSRLTWAAASARRGRCGRRRCSPQWPRRSSVAR
jgi:xanthine dehydrogenase YagR molybdenum-binding subunit